MGPSSSFGAPAASTRQTAPAWRRASSKAAGDAAFGHSIDFDQLARIEVLVHCRRSSRMATRSWLVPLALVALLAHLGAASGAPGWPVIHHRAAQ